MSNETANSEATAQSPEAPLPSIVITRNGVPLELKTYKIVKGDNKGKRYLAPTITPENFNDIQTWIGQPNVIAVEQRNLKQSFQSIFFDSFDEKTGEFLHEKFVKEAENFTNAGLKKAEIEQQLDEAQGQQVDLMAGGLDENGQFSPETTKKMLALRDTIAALRAMLDEKSRKGKADKEAEAAVEVK